MGLRSGLFRESTPPVDFFLVEESLRSPTRVLQVIILYELVLVTLIIIINGISVVSGTLQKRSAPMKPSKMQILVAPGLLIPPTHEQWRGDRALVAENHVVESVATL